MAYDEFFSDGDKPYSENLNDGLLLMDAFDVTVPCEMPGMFSNGQFSSTTNVARKAGVAIVTLKSVASGVTVGTDSISGTGDVVFRVYPNFNGFYKWMSIILEKTGTVGIAFKKADGTNISATVAADGTISEAAALKELAEIDVVLTLSSATISNILINFVNNQTSGRTRVGALLEASQLANVNGSVAENETKAVNGGTVYTALDTLDTDLSGDISDLETNKEDVSNKVITLDSSDSHYPSCSAVKTVTDTKENISNKKTTLSNSSVYYPTTGAVKTVTDNIWNAIADLISVTASVNRINLASGRNVIQCTVTACTGAKISAVLLSGGSTQRDVMTPQTATSKEYTNIDMFPNTWTVPQIWDCKITVVAPGTDTVIYEETFPLHS